MKFGRRRNLFNWHKKSQIDLLPSRWALRLLITLIIIGLIYFVVMLGSMRFFVKNYFQIAGLNKNYLIVLQNQYEIRPTGGFVSAYGVLKFRFFVPTSFEIKDSFSVGGHEYIEPPEVLGKLLDDPWYEGHTFRDANWNPDFTVSAQDLISFYNKVSPETEIEGVVGVNFSVVENLVAKFGGVNLGDELIKKENLFYFLEYQTKDVDKHDEKALEERKQVLNNLGKALIKKSFLKIPTVAQVMSEALEEKEIQIWSDNNRFEEKIREKGWGGLFVGDDYRDYLSVNFANLGGKKSDRYLEKKVDYIVDFQENQSPVATLKITLNHYGDYSIVSDAWKGYVRTYIPNLSKIKTSVSDVYEENNLKVIGEELILKPGETKVLEYKYELPVQIMNKNQYFLNLLKQSGTEVDYNVVLKVPGDMRIESDEFVIKENRAFYQEILEKDQSFIVTMFPDSLPPLIYDQKFDELNKIAIIFNEKLDKLNASDIENYMIEDLNYENEKTDKIEINRVEYDGNTIVRLWTSGITKQPLERYKVTLKNIQDEAGNLVLPIPKMVTVVQRFDK